MYLKKKCTPLILYTGKKKKLPTCISPGPNLKPLSTDQSFSVLLEDVIQNENDEEKMPHRFQE